MPSGKSSLQLGESWVVEEEDESPDYSPRKEEADPIRHSPRRRTRGSYRTSKSPEPQLVMPSLDLNSIDGSWTENSIKTSRYQTGSRYSEIPETRRRAQGNGSSPEKRNKTRISNGQKTFSSAPTRSLAPAYDNTTPVQDLFSLAATHISSMLSWLLDVLTSSLRILKTPISYLLALWLLFGAAVMVRNLITTSVYASLSPLCRIPGASLIDLPFCQVPSGNGNSPPPPVEFDQLMTVQSNFEQVLEESAGGASLPLDMKRGEASIRDLRQLVRYSHLQSR